MNETNETIEQRPTPPNVKIYIENIVGDESSRQFYDVLSRNAKNPPYPECTQEYYDWWQETYNPQPEPPQPEPIDTQIPQEV